MHRTELPISPLPELRAVELTSAHVPLLQRFLEANPEYSLAVNGEPVRPDEAHDAIHGTIPAGWAFTKKWLIGYVDTSGALAAMASVITDLLAPGVCHIGLFMVATSRHGTGDAQTLYGGLEAWANASGANWLRLGVVKGNTRAERFWRAQGFIEARIREGIEMGKRINTVRVMFKPLSGGTLEQYQLLIARDHPDWRSGH